MSLSVLSVPLPRNVPGSQTSGYSRSHYHNAPQGNWTTRPTYGDPYVQPPMSPRVQPGMPMRYNTSHWQASQQPPNGRLGYDPLWPIPPADFPLPPGVEHQQSPRPMTASWSPSQDIAGSHNAWARGGSYSSRSSNESDFPYNSDSGGFVGQQNPSPMTATRSQLQGSAGDWNVMGGSHRGQAANESYSPRPPAGFFCRQNPRPMTAAPPYQVLAGVRDASGPYP